MQEGGPRRGVYGELAGGSQRSAANLWGFGDTIEIANSNGKIRNRMQRSRYTTEMVPHSWR